MLSRNSFPFHTLLLAAGLLAASTVSHPSSLDAQQYVVDDAAIVDHGACQLEAWHGRRASWILPACQPIRNLEIAMGAGFIDDGDGAREPEYAIEAKTLLRPLAPDSWGVGLVVGVGPNPGAVGIRRRLGDVYAFVPVSLSLASDRLVLHGNAGWAWEREDVDHGDHVHEGDGYHLTWGARADLSLTPLVSLIAEFAGEDDTRPEYQAGFRIHLTDAGVETDVSWGGSMERGRGGAGITVGVQFVSGTIF